MSEEKNTKEEKVLSDDAVEGVTGGDFWDTVKEYFGIQKPGTPKDSEGSQPGTQTTGINGR